MRGWVGLLLLAVAFAVAGERGASAGGVCKPIDKRQLRCTIETLADCQAIRDYPYARTLFCPAAFAAAQAMAAEVAATLGVPAPAGGFFYYFQTLADPQAPPDDQSQTTVACLDTPAPWSAASVTGAGIPLCHLVAYVTSPGPLPPGIRPDGDNPLPSALRSFPQYFASLYAPRESLPLARFRADSAAFDAMIRHLGRAGRDGFVADYRPFSTRKIYDPASWQRDTRYHGISGGGGGGWGGEIAVTGIDRRAVVTLLAFGGGGGGGMTSYRRSTASAQAETVLGAGGGGGVQFANGYRFEGRQYVGLGLGAGTGSDETKVQYSYNDFAGSPNPPRPADRYNPAVIAEYRTQLQNLAGQLKARLASGKTVVVRGGGGMGAGTEYVMSDGQEYVPHALSTQAGFQWSYEFRAPTGARKSADAGTWRGLDAELDDVYKLLGDFYRRANARALAECGGDYSNFACICPKAHAMVVCLVGDALGDPAKIPAWLQEPHCPEPRVGAASNGLTSYQQFLLDHTVENGGTRNSCSSALLGYFSTMNTPSSEPY